MGLFAAENILIFARSQFSEEVWSSLREEPHKN